MEASTDQATTDQASAGAPRSGEAGNRGAASDSTVRRPRRRRRAGLALAIVAASGLLGAACGDDDSAAGDGGGGGEDEPTVDIRAPADGAGVPATFDLEVDTSLPIGEPGTGRHHVHLFYDGNTADGQYDMAFTSPFTVVRLGPGEHTIEAVIANADHTLTDARSEVTVMVGDGPAGGAGTADATTDTTTGGGTSGYGY